MNKRQLSITAGVSYLVIFCSAIFANFIALEALLNDPVTTVVENGILVRMGVMAFIVAAVFDVIVGWALYEMYKGNPLSAMSTYFRVMHAGMMGVAVFALLATLGMTDAKEILAHVDVFNNIWLTGLLFFGVHLIFLGRIIKDIKIIPWLLTAAGVMYIVDTSAHFLMANYADYADMFLAVVAVTSIVGEMYFSLWLLFKGGKNETVTIGD